MEKCKFQMTLFCKLRFIGGKRQGRISWSQEQYWLTHRQKPNQLAYVLFWAAAKLFLLAVLLKDSEVILISMLQSLFWLQVNFTVNEFGLFSSTVSLSITRYNVLLNINISLAFLCASSNNTNNAFNQALFPPFLSIIVLHISMWNSLCIFVLD